MTHPTLQDLQNEATWLERRALIPAPYKATDMVTTDDSRAEFLEGARLLRLDQLRNYAGEQIGPTPIQLAVADTIASGKRQVAIMEPRRSGKTSGAQAVLLGRCALRQDYLVGWTLATAGYKASERFRKDIAGHLMRIYPDKASMRAAGFRLDAGKGSEAIIWPGTGSYFNVYTPSGDAFRSNAFDVAWVDESGEAEVAMGEDLTASIRPTLHTRHGAQFIMSGTAGTFRAGQLLWDALNDDRSAVLWHGIGDDVDPELLEQWDTVRELVLAAHPGIGYTTPLEAIEDDFNTPAMRKGFNQEILSMYGLEGSNVALLNSVKWQESARPITKLSATPPAKFCMVPFVHPDGTYASVGAAWRGTRGKIRVGLMHWQMGTDGFAKKLLTLSRKHKHAIVYDARSAATEVEMKTLREAKPAPLEKPVLGADIARAAVHFTKLLNEGKLEHFDQRELTTAAEVAVKRAFSTGTGWAFGRPKGQEGADISGIEAVALAAYKLSEERGKRELSDIDLWD